MTRTDLLRFHAENPVSYTPDLPIRVIPFAPSHAAGIAKLTYATYGDTYPVDDWYDEKAVIRRHTPEDTHSVVCLNSEDTVVGVLMMYKSSAPFYGLKEAGMMMVAPPYRGEKVAYAMSVATIEYFNNTPEIAGIYGEAVCNHTASQKLALSQGLQDTGVEIALVPPSDSMGADKKTTERVSCVFNILIKKTDPPQSLYIPPRYKKQIESIYKGLPVKRSLLTDPVHPVSGDSEIEVEKFPAPSVVRINIKKIGADITGRLSAELAGTTYTVSQVFISLSGPGTGNLCEVLRNHGFYFGGIIPRWLDADVMLMQKTPPHFNEIKIVSDEGNRILEMVKADHNSLSTET